MSESPYVRVNTAERERALAELSRHFGGGRVGPTGFSERGADTGAPRHAENLLAGSMAAGASPQPPGALPKLAVLSGAIVAAALALTFTSGSWFWLLLLAGVPAVAVRVLRHG